MAENKKCAHPSCNCHAKEGSDYCSSYCEGAGKAPDIHRTCGHPDCAVTARV